MLQNIALPPFGSNGPLWSLAHEWWYYLLFPLLLSCIRSQHIVRIGSIVVTCVLLSFLTSHILILFGVWLIGVLGWSINHGAWLPPWIAMIFLALALVSMRLELRFVPYGHQFLVGFAFALSVNSFAISSAQWPCSRASQWLADFSYSLYLTHFPIAVLLVAVLFDFAGVQNRLPPNVISGVAFFGIVLTCLAMAYVVSLVTEARTNFFRSCFYRVVGVPTHTRRPHASSDSVT